jgi:hypothetical protein
MPSNEDQIDMARACQVLAAQPFSVMLGAKLLALDLGHAEVAVPIGANVRQHNGIAHGGLHRGSRLIVARCDLFDRQEHEEIRCAAAQGTLTAP